MRWITALIVIAYFITAHGATALASGWTETALTVKGVITEGSTTMLIAYTEGGGVYANGCAANNWIVTGIDAEKVARLYSTLMTAVVTGKKVKFWYLDACSSWNYHEATNLRLTNEGP